MEIKKEKMDAIKNMATEVIKARATTRKKEDKFLMLLAKLNREERAFYAGQVAHVINRVMTVRMQQKQSNKTKV